MTALTVQRALLAARQRIAPASESAAADAQFLLCEVLGVDRAFLLAHPEQRLTPEQQARFSQWVERCAAGEPLAYILGRRAFYDREFGVTPAVLIPRPETELLLEQALAFVRLKPAAVVVDVGTGSGALAVTLAVHCPSATVYAIDKSPAALAVARQNAEHYEISVNFFEGDLLMPLIEQRIRVDLIMANLPYIAHDALMALPVARYEPLLALDGGPDGLDLVRQLLAQAPSVFRPDGLILLEIGADQGAAARELARSAFPAAAICVLNDYAGLERMVRIER
jgi:release factor glutamine methyltransferase